MKILSINESVAFHPPSSFFLTKSFLPRHFGWPVVIDGIQSNAFYVSYIVGALVSINKQFSRVNIITYNY